MTDNQKTWIASALQTFISVFLTVVGTTISTGAIQWTAAFWASILLVAVRAAVKAILQKSPFPLFGGVK